MLHENRGVIMWLISQYMNAHQIPVAIVSNYITNDATKFSLRTPGYRYFTQTDKTTFEFRVWLSNCTNRKLWDIVPHLCCNRT